MFNETPEEKARRIGVPVIPKIKPFRDVFPSPHKPAAVCGECGMEMMSVMGYVCPRGNCPCFPRVTC